MKLEIKTVKHEEALQIPPDQEAESTPDEERQRDELLGKEHSLR